MMIPSVMTRSSEDEEVEPALRVCHTTRLENNAWPEETIFFVIDGWVSPPIFEAIDRFYPALRGKTAMERLYVQYYCTTMRVKLFGGMDRPQRKSNQTLTPHRCFYYCFLDKTMVSRFSIVALSILHVGPCVGFQFTNSYSKTRSHTVKLTAQGDSRRAFLATGAAAALSFLTSSPPATAAAAAADDEEEEELEEVYLGCGCFWHVQHELVEAERSILGRSEDELTSRAGYAGGKAGAKDGKVCYHNAANIADYGKLGHAEVVSLKVPPSKFRDFAVEYCKLFKNGMRPDQLGDRGSEYRNLVAFKGGSKSPLAQQLVEASKATGDQLDFAVGKGSDDDIARLVWIMNIDQYPFFIGEQYHQFHDGFNFGENYPNSYNSLAQKYAQKGENFGSCPNGMMGVGIGGL
jgi:peptide methionine sulfoxide reductase MsrA